MGGKILVAEKADIAQLRAEQGIIRPEPGSLRSRHVLVPPQQGVQQSEECRQQGKNALLPVARACIRPGHEHDHGGGDQAQVRHALIIKPGGKPRAQEKITAPQPQREPARQAGAWNLVSPDDAEAEQQKSRRQKAGRKKKGVPFPPRGSRCQGKVKKRQKRGQHLSGSGFSNARRGGLAGDGVWHG